MVTGLVDVAMILLAPAVTSALVSPGDEVKLLGSPREVAWAVIPKSFEEVALGPDEVSPLLLVGY